MKKRTKVQIVVFFFLKKRPKRGREESLAQEVFLISKFLRDPTVGSRRDKRQSCSTHRGLRVGSGFVGF